MQQVAEVDPRLDLLLLTLNFPDTAESRAMFTRWRREAEHLAYGDNVVVLNRHRAMPEDVRSIIDAVQGMAAGLVQAGDHAEFLAERAARVFTTRRLPSSE